MWLVYIRTSHRKEQNRLSYAVKLAACVIPAAYLIKTVLQYAFGRTNLRMWLRVGGPVEFRWFDPTGGGGFPSGHMIVFTALLSVIWLCFPRFRSLAVVLCSALAAALILTSYHFVSDIIAGGYCGILVTAGMDRFLGNTPPAVGLPRPSPETE